MTDEEIEKAWSEIISIDLSDLANYDNCQRLIIPPHYNLARETLGYIDRLKAEVEQLRKAKVIYSTVDYCSDDLADALQEIDRLKAENSDLKELLNVANNREYRKRFIEEVWKQELGNELSTPDMDFVYKLYFELREQLYQTEQKLAECENGYEGTLFLERCKAEDDKEYIRKETAKEHLHDIYCAVNKFLDEDTLEYVFDSVYRKYDMEGD